MGIPDHLKPQHRPLKELFSLPDFDFTFVKQLVAEFLASFIFIFIIVGNDLTRVWSGGATFGIVNGTNKVCAFLLTSGLTYAFGSLSGAHFNPVITCGLMFAMKMNWIVGIIYIVIQFVAAFAGVGILLALFPVSPTGSLGNSRAVNLVVPPGVTDAGYWFYQLLVSIFIVFIYLFFFYDRRPAKVTDNMSNKEKAELRDSRLMYLIRQSLSPLFVGFAYGMSTAYNTPWRQLSVCLIAQRCGKAWIWNVAGFFGALVGAFLYMVWWGLGQPSTPARTCPYVPLDELED